MKANRGEGELWINMESVRENKNVEKIRSTVTYSDMQMAGK